MTITFPTALDSFTDPLSTDKLNSPSHSTMHTDVHSALEAIEAKVGVDSSAVTTSHDYKLSNVTGSDKAVSLTGAETLINKTLNDVAAFMIDNNVYLTGRNNADSANINIIRVNTSDEIEIPVIVDTPLLRTPRITTSIDDANGNEVIETPATASAVNHVKITNAATGNGVTVEAVGDDATVDLSLKPKSTGDLKLGAGDLIWPASDGSADDVLQTDGAGNLTFAALPSTGAATSTLTGGETLTGATLPVPVYQNKTDNEIYACDANDTAKLKFIGFLTSNTSDGTANASVQMSGIVSGFTGLDEGEKYYVQDTVGTIGTTPGTTEVLVGIAISTTQLIIQKGKRYASGSASITGTDTSTVTVGFRVNKVTILTGSDDSTYNDMSVGYYVNGTNMSTYMYYNDSTGNASMMATASSTSVAWDGYRGSSRQYGVVDTITDTTFRLNQTWNSTSSSWANNIRWIAEGEF